MIRLQEIVYLPPWVPLFILIVATFLFSCYRYSTSPYHVWKNLGVDGPPPDPFFGSLLKMYDPNIGLIGCIDSWQKKYGRTFGVYYFRKPVLVVTDKEMLKQILVKQFHNFSDRFHVGDGKLSNRVLKKSLFFGLSSDWQRIRHVVSPTFSSGKLKKVIHHINRTAHHLTDNFHKKSGGKDAIDAKDYFSAYSLDIIAGLAFGLSIDSQSNFDLPFIKNAKKLLTFKGFDKIKAALGGMFPAILPLYELFDVGVFKTQVCDYFEQYIYSLISQRKAQAENKESMDYLQFLLNAEAGEESGWTERKLSSEEIAAQCLLFIIAAYETTSTILQYICYELARNKTIQENVRKEIQQCVGDSKNPTYEQIQDLKYLSAVINEALRMYPPFHNITRQAETACTLNGISIPAKAGIVIPIYNIGRDPEFFEEPNKFNPGRYLKNESHSLNNDVTSLAFGFGPRHCIGSRLAQMQVKIALLHVLRKFIIQEASPDVIRHEDVTGILGSAEPIRLTVQLIGECDQKEPVGGTSTHQRG